MSYYHTERQRFLEPETTNIRVIDPTTHLCPPHACPASLRTTTAPHPPLCSALPPPHTPFAAHPPPSSPATGPPSPCRTCYLVSPTPSLPLRTRAPTLAYKTPTSSSTPISLKAKHTPDKSPLPNRKQPHFPLPRP
jgi:hypothetical protein